MASASTTATPTAMTISARPEYPAVAYNVAKEILAMVSVKAPKKVSEEKKTAVDIVAVIDKSGSMAGAKMQMVKKTLEFIVDQLDENDTFALVMYDSQVEFPLEFSAMDKAGKKKGQDVIKQLCAGSCTNLSGGLLMGLDRLQHRKTKRNKVASLLLLTDGLANEGITGIDQIVAATQNKIKALDSPMSLFTFGFGDDHDPNLLRPLAECGGGMFYYVKNPDDIPLAFADCLGGLQSVTAQNCVVNIRTLNPNIKIIKNLNKQCTVKGSLPNTELELTFSDLYSDEERDLLFLISLPKVDMASEQADPIVDFRLKYFDVVSLMDASCRCQLEISRPTSVADDIVRDMDIDQQFNRLRVADALEESRAMAEKGDYKGAQSFLSNVRAEMNFSPSVATPYVQKLQEELADVETSISSATAYRSGGAQKMNSRAMAHYRQRGANDEFDFYTTSAKASKKSLFSGFSK